MSSPFSLLPLLSSKLNFHLIFFFFIQPLHLCVTFPVEFGKEDEDEGQGGLDVDDSALFIMDTSGNDTVVDDGDKQRKPVWLDEEEETAVNISKVNRLRKLRKEEDETVISGSVYVSRLRAHHAQLNHGPDWANLDLKVKQYDSDDESEVENGVVIATGYKNVDDILKTNEELVMNRGAKLLPGILEYSKLVDGNVEDPSNGPLNSVQFHRNHQLLLATGLDRKLRFFQMARGIK